MLVEVRTLALTVQRRWPLILGCLIVGAGVALAISLNQSPVYEAQAVVSASPEFLELDQEEFRNQLLALITSLETARETSDRYGTPIGADGVRERTDVEGGVDSPAFSLTATGRTPEDAELLARAFRDAVLGRALAAPPLDSLVVPTSEPEANPRRIRPRTAAAVTAGVLLGLLVGFGTAVAELRIRAVPGP